jgi:hypothetical protein
MALLIRLNIAQYLYRLIATLYLILDAADSPLTVLGSGFVIEILALATDTLMGEIVHFTKTDQTCVVY